MNLHWTSKALGDVSRLHDFLVPVDRNAAAHTVQRLTGAPSTLIENPRLGERLEEFDPREVRRIIVGPYELRYEIQGQELYVLRIWHTREQR